MTRIAVPAPVLYAGGALLAVLLLAVGFLAGRAGPGAGGLPSTHASAPAPSGLEGTASEPSALPFESAQGDARTPDVAAPDPPPPAALPAAAGAASAEPRIPVPSAPDQRREVTLYFQQMDAAQKAAGTWSDPKSAAEEIMAAALRGDSSGFEKLIAASTAAREGVRAVAAPPACAEHHALTLAVLDDGLRVLTAVRDGMASGDTSALTALAATGGGLESRARAVEALGASLRSRYGVEAAR